jgi:hypothetical protein
MVALAYWWMTPSTLSNWRIFPRYYGEGGIITPFAPVVEKEWKITIGGKHRRQSELSNGFLVMDISPKNVIYFRHT